MDLVNHSKSNATPVSETVVQEPAKDVDEDLMIVGPDEKAKDDPSIGERVSGFFKSVGEGLTTLAKSAWSLISSPFMSD